MQGNLNALTIKQVAALGANRVPSTAAFDDYCELSPKKQKKFIERCGRTGLDPLLCKLPRKLQYYLQMEVVARSQISP